MEHVDMIAPLAKNAKAAINGITTVLNGTGKVIFGNGQEIQSILVNQLQSNAQRALSSAQKFASCAHPAEAAQAYAGYLAESTRAYAANAADLSQLFLKSWSDVMSPLLEAHANPETSTL
jgi:hypothetical protein